MVVLRLRRFYLSAEPRLAPAQSTEPDVNRRRPLCRRSQRKSDDDARPNHLLHAVTCWQPQVKWLTLMVNSTTNGPTFDA
jgi:hypothetical protein